MKRSQSEKKSSRHNWLHFGYLLCHAEAPTGVQYIQTSKTTRRDARCDAMRCDPPPTPSAYV